MVQLEDIKEYLSKNLSQARYNHSINVAETAKKLALFYGEEDEKAYLAGLIHDCTREMELKQQQELIKIMQIKVDDITLCTKELLHAITAEYILKHRFQVYEEDILTAVRYHTTGREDMSLLEKIIFLSDVIEPSRSFPGVETIRLLSFEDIDNAMVAALNSSLRFLIGKGALIHPDTFLARNYIIKLFKD